MKCANHLDKEAVVLCNRCGKSICSDCLVMMQGENYCKDCIGAINTGKSQERSPALAAILSFIIGGMGQIYNGQVGKGILILCTSWLIIPWIYGIVDAYKTAKKINQGRIVVKPNPGCLIAAIIGVVVFWVSIFFIALLAAIAIPNLLRVRLQANEAQAKSTLKVISTALEAYQVDSGKYPLNESELPTYLGKPYNHQTISGYVFSESLNADSYKVTAEPANCQTTGSKIFSIETGGILSSQDCVKK